MKKEYIKIISEALTRLNGEKLDKIMRAGSMADFGFGDFIEKEIHRYDENKKITSKIISVPRFALHIDCCFRLICGNKIVLSKSDMFQPTTEIENEPDFDWDNFDWDVQRNNRFDEIANNYFGEESPNFIVKAITVNKWGDLKIKFENSFILETFTDSSGSEECWRFFESGSEEHIVVSGQGLENDEFDTGD